MTLVELALAAQDAYVAQGFGERGYHGRTTLYPVGLALLLVACLGTFLLPRKYALAPLLILESVVPTAQRLVVFGLDFNFGRILVVVGMLRIIANGEYARIRLLRLDKVMIAWAAVTVLAYTLLRGSPSALIYKLGLTVDTLGIYALARVWIHDMRDIERIGAWVIAMSIPAAAAFYYEAYQGQNLYKIVGGAAEYVTQRDEQMRCQGPFAHPILAGCFWVALMPLLAIRLWTKPAARISTLLGLACCLFVVIQSSSSTPLMGLGGALMAAAFFPLRRRMRLIRRSALLILVVLHFSMTMPVWHLITRVSVVSGSTGYHRYRLINAAVNRWQEWFLLGTKSTAHWGYYLFDVTNQYVKEAVEGGMLALVLFVWYLSLAFGYTGRLRQFAGRDRRGSIRAWGLGACLFGQCVMFIGVSVTHAQQNLLVWLIPVAASAAILQSTQDAHARNRARSSLPRRSGRSRKPSRSQLQVVTHSPRKEPPTGGADADQ